MVILLYFYLSNILNAGLLHPHVRTFKRLISLLCVIVHNLIGLFSMLFFMSIDVRLSLLYFIFTSDLCCFDLSPPVPPPDHPVHRFAGRTVTSGSLVLVTVATKEEGAAQLTVNCEKMVIGTMLVKDILLALTQWRAPGARSFFPSSPLTPTPPLTYHPSHL